MEEKVFDFRQFIKNKGIFEQLKNKTIEELSGWWFFKVQGLTVGQINAMSYGHSDEWFVYKSVYSYLTEIEMYELLQLQKRLQKKQMSIFDVYEKEFYICL